MPSLSDRDWPTRLAADIGKRVCRPAHLAADTNERVCRLSCKGCIPEWWVQTYSSGLQNRAPRVCRPARWVQTRPLALFWPTSGFCSKSTYCGLDRLPSPGLSWTWPAATRELSSSSSSSSSSSLVNWKKKLLPSKKNHIFFKKTIKKYKNLGKQVKYYYKYY